MKLVNVGRKWRAERPKRNNGFLLREPLLTVKLLSKSEPDDVKGSDQQSGLSSEL
jgi:hypothetical protein